MDHHGDVVGILGMLEHALNMLRPSKEPFLQERAGALHSKGAQLQVKDLHRRVENSVEVDENGFHAGDLLTRPRSSKVEARSAPTGSHRAGKVFMDVVK